MIKIYRYDGYLHHLLPEELIDYITGLEGDLSWFYELMYDKLACFLDDVDWIEHYKDVRLDVLSNPLFFNIFIYDVEGSNNSDGDKLEENLDKLVETVVIDIAQNWIESRKTISYKGGKGFSIFDVEFHLVDEPGYLKLRTQLVPPALYEFLKNKLSELRKEVEESFEVCEFELNGEEYKLLCPKGILADYPYKNLLDKLDKILDVAEKYLEVEYEFGHQNSQLEVIDRPKELTKEFPALN